MPALSPVLNHSKANQNSMISRHLNKARVDAEENILPKLERILSPSLSEAAVKFVRDQTPFVKSLCRYIYIYN